MTPEQREEFRNFLMKYDKVFCTAPENLGCLNDFEYRIKFKDTYPKRFYSRPYRLNPKLVELLHEELNSQQRSGLLEPCSSSYASPLIVVLKKSGKVRVTVDLRKLNQQIEHTCYPLTSVDQVIDEISNRKAKYYTTLDFVKSYHQIKISRESRPYFAFHTNTGSGSSSLAYTRLVQGFRDSAFCFTAQINRILSDVLTKTKSVCFVDDLVIMADTVQEMMDNLGAIFDRLIEYNMTLGCNKNKFCKLAIEFLSHYFNQHGRSPTQDRISVIKNYPKPKNPKETKGFLGTTGYYRAYLKDYSKTVADLFELTRKDTTFTWEEKHQKAFDKIKEQMTSAPVLIHPDQNRIFYICADASIKALGFSISHKPIVDENGKVTTPGGVCCYAGRSFNKNEVKYTIHVKELLAIVQAFRYFSHYLILANTIVLCDRSSLVILAKSAYTKKDIKHSTAVVERLFLELSSFDYTLEFKRGRDNSLADGISRLDNLSDKPINKPTKIQEFYDTQCDTSFEAKKQESKEVNSVMELLNQPDQTDIPPREEQWYEYTLFENVNDIVQTAPVSATEEIEIPNLEQLQKECEDISELYEFIKTKKLRRNTKLTRTTILNEANYVIRDGILLHLLTVKRRNKDEPEESRFIYRVLAPKVMRHAILEQIHGVGHHAIDKCYAILRSKWYWSNCYQDTLDYIRTCEICAKAKKTRPRPNQLQPIGYDEKFYPPLSRFHIDIFGPLNPSMKNKRYILTAIDAFTGYPFLYPLENATAPAIANKLSKAFATFGYPQIIVSDLGMNFLSVVLKNLFNIYNIQHRKTSSRHPCCNGQIERMHAPMHAALRKLTESHPSRWCEYITAVTFALRCSPSQKTLMTPIFAVTGRNVRSPIDMTIPDELIRTTEVSRESLEKFISDFETVREIQMDNIERAQQRNLIQHGKRSISRKFNKGEYVYYYVPVKKVQISPKITNFFRGPYIIEWASPKGDFYKIKNPNTQELWKHTVPVQSLVRCDLYHKSRIRREHEERQNRQNKLPQVHGEETNNPLTHEGDTQGTQITDNNIDKDIGQITSTENTNEHGIPQTNIQTQKPQNKTNGQKQNINVRKRNREQQMKEKREQEQNAERERETHNKEREIRLAKRNQYRNTEETTNTDSQTENDEDEKMTRATDEEHKIITADGTNDEFTQEDIHTHQNEHTEFVRNFHNQENDSNAHTDSKRIEIEDILKITNLMQQKDRTFKYQLMLKGHDRPKWMHQNRLPPLPEHMIAEIRERRTNKGKIRRKHKYKRRSQHETRILE